MSRHKSKRLNKKIKLNEFSCYSGKSTTNRKVILECESLEYVQKMGYDTSFIPCRKGI
jgi:hypothetical protein